MSTKYDQLGKNYRAKSQDTIQNNSDNFFPTYHALTRHLLNNLKFNKLDTFLEPCAGAGDIIKVLKEYGYDNVDGFDIKPRAENITEADALSGRFPPYDNIITNPPFKLSIKFFKMACYTAEKNICFIWPLDYLHGVERYDVMYEKGCNNFRLKTCYAFVRRPLFNAKFHPVGPMPTGATSFAWFHFEKNYQGDPVIKWLHNNSDMGQPWEAEQLLMI